MAQNRAAGFGLVQGSAEFRQRELKGQLLAPSLAVDSCALAPQLQQLVIGRPLINRQAQRRGMCTQLGQKGARGRWGAAGRNSAVLKWGAGSGAVIARVIHRLRPAGAAATPDLS